MATTRNLRHRILTCMTKLSDRDTHSQAISELESIISTLSPDTFSLFINSLSSTTTADRSATRSAALRLLATLSTTHGPSLTSYLPKLISAVIRRLRDPDTAVRSSAAKSTAAFAAHIAASFGSILRPLSDSLSTEQDTSAQSAAALCLSSAIDSSPEIDAYLIVKLLPKWMKLLKCEGFKAKSSLLVLIRSSVRVCEIGNCNLLRDLVNCLVDYLKNDDWSARKASAEALKEIAQVETDSLSEVKANCLKIFESRKFDKVKAVREAMNEMLEVWKEIPDVFDDGSPPPRSQTSSKENASDGRFPGRSKISSGVDSNNTPQTRKNHVPLRKSSPSDSALKTTARNIGAIDYNRKKSTPAVNGKLDSRRLSGSAADLHGSSVTSAYENNPVGDDEGDFRPSKPEIKRGLFNKNHVSRVVPYSEEHSGVTGAVSNTSADTCRHHKDSEDLSEIRKQLVQIENQQSSLMDLLQKFIGSSQDGMRSLETRVHGLERALDDVSYDLAVSTARMSTFESSRTSSCCLLPGSDFLSSRFWRRPEGRCSTSRFSFSGNTPSVSGMCNLAERSPAGDPLKPESRRFRLRGAGGVIVNPLAEIHGGSRGISEAASCSVLKSVPNNNIA